MNGAEGAGAGQRIAATRLWYFSALGMLSGAAVFAFAALPREWGGVVSFVAVVLAVGVDRLPRDAVDLTPRGPVAIGYTVFSGIVFLSSLALAATVARGDALWLAGVVAVSAGAACAGSAWVPNRAHRR